MNNNQTNTNEIVVSIQDISMMFNKSSEKIDNIRELIIKGIRHQLMFEEFWALKNISLDIKRGEFIGVIGLNGSGKSTLLKCIAGVLVPTRGKVVVNGSIAPLIELGAGFDPNLSARENVYLNGAVLGKSRKEMNRLFDSIIEFAELAGFVDTPIKNFSSGMQARLGFAIATSFMSDVLIVDEVLALGDLKFQKKCEERMADIFSRGTTVIFVSHDIDQVRELCSKVIWLDKGIIRGCGDTDSVCDCYCSTYNDKD
jgi:ABC-type polysaccharide/polyol phosphate transport system ATPase subunit